MWGKNKSFYRAEAFMFMRERSKIAEEKRNYLGEVRQEKSKKKNACEKGKGDDMKEVRDK